MEVRMPLAAYKLGMGFWPKLTINAGLRITNTFKRQMERIL